mgnify:CR=1 FL=1
MVTRGEDMAQASERMRAHVTSLPEEEFASLSTGTKLEIEIFGNRVPVTVGAEPLFDPKNERLRS